MVKLERSLSLLEVTLMSVGIILGAGIYVVIGEAAGLTGNSVWIAFVIGAVVAAFTGLSYAELCSRFPRAGAEYIYVQNSFGRSYAWVTGWLIIAGNVIGAATVSLGFGNYFNALFGIIDVFYVAVIVLIISGIILIAGVKETASVTIIFTIIEATGLAIIIFIGMQKLGSVNYLQILNGMEGLIKAGVLIFFSYLGFQGITQLAEETKRPEKTIPKAIIYSIIITTIIYILVGISAVSVIPGAQLADKSAPLAEIANVVFGSKSFILLSGIALFSTFNTALMMLLTGSRLVYGMAREKALPKLFKNVSKKTLAPWAAVICVTLGSIIVLFLGDLKHIANLTNFTVFTVFIIVNSALIYLSYKKPKNEGFKVPLRIKNIPVFAIFGILSSIFMIFYISFNVIIMGLALIGIGVIFYFLLSKFSSEVEF